MNLHSTLYKCMQSFVFKLTLQLLKIESVLYYIKRAHNMFSTDKLIVKNSLYYILKIVLLKFKKPDLLN